VCQRSDPRTEEGIARREQWRRMPNDSDLDTCRVKAPVSRLNYPQMVKDVTVRLNRSASTVARKHTTSVSMLLCIVRSVRTDRSPALQPGVAVAGVGWQTAGYANSLAAIACKILACVALALSAARSRAGWAAIGRNLVLRIWLQHG